MSDWQDCIVILIDLIGIRALAAQGDSQASTLMRQFHEAVRHEMNERFPSLNHAYVWNDAVLLLAHVDGQPCTVEASIKDAVQLKEIIDVIKPAFAIAVMGKSFPMNNERNVPRVTVLRTSSYAMANCFEIEKAMKDREFDAAWYIDERIVNKLNVPKQASMDVVLLPDGDSRKIYMYARNPFALGGLDA